MHELQSPGPVLNVESVLPAVAKQAKLLGQKLKVDQAAEEDDDDEDEDDKDGAGKWGKKKRDYYNADNFDYEVPPPPSLNCPPFVQTTSFSPSGSPSSPQPNVPQATPSYLIALPSIPTLLSFPSSLQWIDTR